MNDDVIITVLVENTVHGRGMMAEHGLAFHLQVGTDSLLFDTGQSALLVHNASRLGVDLSRLGAMALSHGHYDHTGGLRAVWKLAPTTPLYAHPAILTSRYVRNPDGNCRPVGITKPNLEAIQAHCSQVHHTQAMSAVLPGFFLTGEIPRTTEFEEVGSAFVLSEVEAQSDPITDDQALFFDTRDGVVVLLGCAHAGVVNTLRYVRRLTNDRPIHAVLGGMHLLTAGPEQVMRTVEALRTFDINRLGPAHCTGAAATTRLWREFPQACTSCAVGSRFAFHR
jgi:7,8-dihydropterin-6-yl-methyl-4-(beta-D-ribofuranosyl)aminobenzene 5'-phosphate synthase